MKEDWYVIRGGAEPKERAAGGAVKKPDCRAPPARRLWPYAALIMINRDGWGYIY